jgi:hypothetical protein
LIFLSIFERFPSLDEDGEEDEEEEDEDDDESIEEESIEEVDEETPAGDDEGSGWEEEGDLASRENPSVPRLGRKIGMCSIFWPICSRCSFKWICFKVHISCQTDKRAPRFESYVTLCLPTWNFEAEEEEEEEEDDDDDDDEEKRGERTAPPVQRIAIWESRPEGTSIQVEVMGS